MKKKTLIVLLCLALGWGAVSTGMLVKNNKDTAPETETETAAVAVTDMVI